MCDNIIEMYVPSGWDYKPVHVKCGNTDPWGDRARCGECLKDPARRAEHDRIMAISDADNAWLRSAGWGEI